MNTAPAPASRDITSQVIDLLRFPLIVGVVFIHGVIPGISWADSDMYPAYLFVARLFSGIIPTVAVPLFFLFSGYLFFRDTGKRISPATYAGKLRKRFRTLVVPYLFWNLLAFAVLYTFTRNETLIAQLGIRHTEMGTPFPVSLWYSSIWSVPVNCPIAWQFWFVRDLIVCVIISPLLQLLACRTRGIGIIALGAAWLMSCELPGIGSIGFSTVALFFFSLGAWCRANRPDMVNLACKLRVAGWMWPVFIALQFASLPAPVAPIIGKLTILSGIVFCLWLGAWLINHGVKSVPQLTASSFFIFAYHVLYGQSPVRKILFAIFHPESDAAFVAIYFALQIITIALGVVAFGILSRWLPRFTAIITGGRILQQNR